MVSFRDILPPQPHYLSGYSGFVPGYKFQHGRSFGSLTHDLFLNPSVKRSSMSVLTDLKTEHNSRPNIYELDTIANRCDYRECKYNVDLKPGYDGHVPNKKEFFGKGYSVESAMGLSMFEKTKRHCSCLECKERKIQPIETKESFENINNYSFPLTKVPGGEKKFIEENRQHLPMPPSGSPYFIDNASVHKTFMSGYSGHVPRLPIYHGLSYSIAVKKALCEFTTRYNRLMREKVHKNNLAVFNAEPDKNTSIIVDDPYKDMTRIPFRMIPYEQGIIKNYAGHIPGYKYNVGNTFADGSKKARNVLKSDT